MGYGMESNTEYDMEPKMGEDADYDGERGPDSDAGSDADCNAACDRDQGMDRDKKADGKNLSEHFSISECSYTATRQRPARKMALREARLRARAGSWQS